MATAVYIVAASVIDSHVSGLALGLCRGTSCLRRNKLGGLGSRIQLHDQI